MKVPSPGFEPLLPDSHQVCRPMFHDRYSMTIRDLWTHWGCDGTGPPDTHFNSPPERGGCRSVLKLLSQPPREPRPSGSGRAASVPRRHAAPARGSLKANGHLGTSIAIREQNQQRHRSGHPAAVFVFYFFPRTVTWLWLSLQTSSKYNSA